MGIRRRGSDVFATEKERCPCLQSQEVMVEAEEEVTRWWERWKMGGIAVP
jgi:hypothetical protein